MKKMTKKRALTLDEAKWVVLCKSLGRILVSNRIKSIHNQQVACTIFKIEMMFFRLNSK